MGPTLAAGRSLPGRSLTTTSTGIVCIDRQPEAEILIAH